MNIQLISSEVSKYNSTNVQKFHELHADPKKMNV